MIILTTNQKCYNLYYFFGIYLKLFKIFFHIYTKSKLIIKLRKSRYTIQENNSFEVEFCCLNN